MIKKYLVAILGLMVFVNTIGAEVTVKTKIGARLHLSVDVGGNFDGWDAKESMGGLAGLYFFPYKKLEITNTPARDYVDAINNSGLTDFNRPSMSSYIGLEILSASTELMKDAMALQESLNAGTITEDEHKKKFEKINERSAVLDANLNAVVTTSTFHELDKISFGIISGYYGTHSVEKTAVTDTYEEKEFVSIQYIPVMASFQHNFSTIIGNMRHIKTVVTIPYETPKYDTWSYTNTQLYAFYRISGGLGLIQESGGLDIDYAPVARIELGLSSRDSLFSWINTSIGYQRLFTDFTTMGSLFINWSLAIS